MQRVIIVDDEYLTVEGINRLKDWGAFDMEVCGVAYDGVSALQIVEELRPDILISDIRMPGMNGLELIEAAKNVLPDAIFIIISGYNEFEYVRLALRLGVIDYIDKPVTVEKMHAVLRNIDRIIKARRAKSLGMPLDPSDEAIFRMAIIQLISAPGATLRDLAVLEQQFGLNLLGIRSILVCAARQAPEQGQSQGQEWLEDGEIAQRVRDLGIGVLVFPYESVVTILFYCDSDACFDSRFHNRLADISAFLIENERIACMGSGNSHMSLANLAHAFQEARQALHYAEFFDEDYMRLDDMESRNAAPLELFSNENSIAFNLRTGRSEETVHQVRQTVDKLLSSNLSLDLFCHECLKLMYLGMGICEEFGNEFMPGGKLFMPYAEMRRHASAAEIGAFVGDSFARMADWLSANKKSGRTEIDKARSYINEHFQEQITLEMLAGMCGMHPTYFSLMFKERVGQTYVKYLNKVRLEHAKYLLTTNAKIKDVCRQSGFYNFRHFCNKFKIYYGCTPEQYRKRREI